MTLNVFRFTGINSTLAIKGPVRCATTANIALIGLQAIDGVTLVSTDTNLRVLVKNQTDARQNGIYDSQSGNWTRSTDWDTNDDFISGTRVIVAGGTTQQGVWVLTTADPITVGTSNMTFVPAFNVDFINSGRITTFDALAPTSTQGDIIYNNGTTNTRLPAGTPGQPLITEGSTAAPGWLASTQTSGYLLQANGAGVNPSWAGFQQAGSGAVTRTWQSKVLEEVSAADFGAAGDVVQAQYVLSISSGNNILTATGASFTANDVGKLISIPGAGVAGAGLSTTITGFTNSTTVTVAANASTSLVSVTSYIAYGTNQTTSLQNWINQLIAGGQQGYLPPGAYAINAALAVALTNSNGITIYGAGSKLSARTTIVPFNYTQDVFDVTCAGGSTAAGIIFQGLAIQGAPNATFSSSLMTGGNGISITSPSTIILGPTIRDCRFYGIFTSMLFKNCAWFTVDNCIVENVPALDNTFGVVVQGVNSAEMAISNSLIVGPSTAQGGGISHGSGILHQNGVNLKIVNSEIFGWQNAILVFLETGAGAGGNACGGLLVTNSVLGPVDFALNLNKNTGTAYTNVILVSNQIVTKQGIQDDSNAGWLNGVQIANNWFDLGNGLSAGAGTGVILNHTTNLTVLGNIFTQTAANCAAINLGSGTTQGVVADNPMNGMTTKITNASTSVIVRDNAGYNPVGTSAATAMGASPFTYTAGASPETHYVNQSATNTATIAKGSQQVAALVNASTYYQIHLEPFESYVTTWATTAPTYTKDVH